MYCLVIANYLELGGRVAEDVEAERLREEARRLEVRLRIQQRRSQEQKHDEEDSAGRACAKFKFVNFFFLLCKM